ncbi:RNA dependent RNA polymerase-domain-containing protein [Fennellomyces sp. T-0311]|nr:RNA dependent RNA polymerase-domain-containing protein [Fennellomyces sp. T-0311]
MEFAPKGFVANHPWRDSDNRSDRVWVHARSLSLGTMLAPKTYVNHWTCTRDVNVMFDYGLRHLSVYFLHLGRRYRIDSHFGDIDGDMKMECEGNITHLTFSLRCPTRAWREKIIAMEDGGARPDIRATNKQVYKTWERTLDIPLDADAERCIEAEPKRVRCGVFPSFASHRVNLATWLTIRLKFEPEDWMRKDLNTMITCCTEFNLIPPNFNHRRQAPLRVLPASQLDMTHTHERRAQRIQDFDVLYYLECAISQGIVNEINLEDEIYDLLNEAGRIDPSYPRGIMMELLANTSRVWKPYDACYNILSKKRSNVGVRQAIPDHCVPIRKIMVTPATMYLQPPTIEVTNRVVRHFSDYADRFIRVQFVDEGTTRISATFGGHSSSAIYARIYKVMQHGIQIGRRRYDFLAFSSSQLRGHGCWFFAPTRELTCNMIRAWMGTFDHIKIVAKNAVRMGQCFSTTIPTILLNENQVEVIDDIERNGYTFSDGVGKIAPSLARDVAAHLQLETTPSCIQFRLGGAKGVLAISNFLSGKRIQLRPSQIKFDSVHTMLEVIRTSTYLPAYLNRQAITLLSALGVKDPIFMRMTEKMVNAMNYMLRNPSAAIKLICQNMDEHGNANTMARIIGSGFLERSDPYIINMLNVFRVSKLKDLKEKARIHVPNGAFLVGILDDTGSLEEGEIYVRISNNLNDTGSQRRPPIVGPCVIFRNPCFHPGDVRVVTAVDKSALRHLFDVVVFSSKGFRDLPSMLSGGDLDGDDYTQVFDQVRVCVA